MLNGAPPEGHERQCHSRSRVTQQRCRRWALKDSDYCQFHGGRSKRGVPTTNKLPSIYRKGLKDGLVDLLESLASQPHHDQIALYEELALSRMCAQQALALATPVLSGEKVDAQTQALTVSLLKDALNNVRDMCIAVSKIEKDKDDRVSLKVVDLFIIQILRAIYRVCGDEHAELAVRLEEEITSTVQLPKDIDVEGAVAGTDSLPSDVQSMDSSITGEE